MIEFYHAKDIKRNKWTILALVIDSGKCYYHLVSSSKQLKQLNRPYKEELLAEFEKFKNNKTPSICNIYPHFSVLHGTIRLTSEVIRSTEDKFVIALRTEKRKQYIFSYFDVNKFDHNNMTEWEQREQLDFVKKNLELKGDTWARVFMHNFDKHLANLQA